VAQQGVSVEGLNLLLRNLRKVDKDYPKQAKVIHQEIAEPVAARARTKARRKSGRMAASIRPYATQRKAEIGAGARVIYAGVQHYGWPAHGISPNPFLTDSINEMQKSVLVDYDRRLDRWITQIWQDNT
jgi:hypothetical protein